MSAPIPPLPPFQPQWADFQVWWQLAKSAIDANIEDLQSQVTAIAAAQAAAAAAQASANAAQTTATTANTNAAAAQSTANTVKRDDSITASYPAPGTVLSASDAGSSATISVAAHTRVYGDISSVSVSAGSVTGLAYLTDYYVYYDDPTRAGGAVTYHADTNANHALPNKAAGRHFVGKITTPASGGGATSGGASAPAGGGGVDKSDLTSTL